MNWLVLIASALAGTVYINNIAVPTLPVVEMKDVTVRFDAAGNVSAQRHL